MFTVLANSRNSNLYLISALAVMTAVLVTFAVVPAISAPAPAGVPVTGMSDSTSDYYQRHPELGTVSAISADVTGDFFLRHPALVNNVQKADLNWPLRPVIISVPVRATGDLSDYYARQRGLNASAVATVDIDGDFYLRHPDLAGNIQGAAIPMTGSAEGSDYFQRHPVMSLPAAAEIDTADYFTRHPELLPVDTTNLSDYFLRH